MKKFSLSALAAAGLLAGGLSVGSANAADLGGDCCADLEERVAELEATTVRKGNRKVSLTISGWVAEQLMYWDDGTESDIYQVDAGSTLDTNVKFSGTAQITPSWSAGYLIHVEMGSNEVRLVDQDSDDGTSDLGGGMLLLQSYWFIKSEQLGKVSIGRVSQASDNTAILVDGSGSLVPANWVTFSGDNFQLRSGGAALGGGHLPPGLSRWRDVTYCHSVGTGVGGDCNGVPLNGLRYDSPTFGGFSVSAGFGEDDFWDVAARYAGELGGLKIAIAAAYSNVTDESALLNIAGNSGKDVDYFQIGGYVQHIATGLFLYGAYGHEESNHLNALTAAAIPDGDVYYIKAGIRQKFTPLGHSVLYGFYNQNEDQVSEQLLAAGATGAEVDIYGAGIVQEIDSAAMSIWLHYERKEGDINTPFGDVSLDELDVIKFGALIAF